MGAVWLVVFEYAGRTWHLSSVDCAPVDQDGNEIDHLPTVTDASFVEALNMGGGITGPCTASVTFTLGLDHDRDLFQMMLEGYQLAQARGEVSIWLPGTLYEERIVLVRGPFIATEVPLPGQPLQGDFSDIVPVAVADWPPAAASLTYDTWPAAPSADDAGETGTLYPFVFGAPGEYTYDVFTGNTAASQCLLVDDTAAAQKGLVAGHPVAATTVHIITTAAPYGGADFAVTLELDGLGRPVSTVDLSSKDGVWTLDGTVAMWVTDWGTGGITKATDTGAILGLGDACLYLLLQRYSEQGSERVDVASWQAAAPILNGWTIGFALTDRGDPMNVVQDLLSICPALWILGGPRGLRPIFLADLPAEQRVTLTEGRDVFWIDQSVTFADIQVCNDCTIYFAEQVSQSVFRGHETIDADSSPQAAASQSRPWGKRSDTLNAPTYDRGTASLCASEQIRMRWTQPILLDYDAALTRALLLQLGQPILLDDPDRGLDSRALYVVGREYKYDLTTALLTLTGWW